MSIPFTNGSDEIYPEDMDGECVTCFNEGGHFCCECEEEMTAKQCDEWAGMCPHCTRLLGF